MARKRTGTSKSAWCSAARAASVRDRVELVADGYAVAFTYAASTDSAHRLVEEIDAGGGEAVAIRADSADPAAIRTAAIKAHEHLGRSTWSSSMPAS